MRISKIRLQRLVMGGLVAALLSSCALDSEIRDLDLTASDWAIAQGYPTLSPVSDFDVARFDAPGTAGLLARIARLQRAVRTLQAPVISTRDRARLNAAITRRIQGYPDV